MSDWLICGVNRSPHAHEVVLSAAAFACDLGLRLMVAYVGDASEPYVEAQDSTAQPSGEDLETWMAREGSIRWDTVFCARYGDPTRELLGLADECHARMLVAGSDGQKGLGGVLFDARSRRLEGGRPPCPVLVVPVGVTRSHVSERPRSAPSVVCGIDDPKQAEFALAHAAEMAWAREARLVLTHVLETRRTPKHDLRSAAQIADAEIRRHAGIRLLERAAQQLAPGESFEMRLGLGDAVSELERLAAAEGADLIVVGSHGHRGLHPASAGSVSSRLADCATRPVLVVPEAASSGRLRRFCPPLRSDELMLAPAS